MRSNIKRCIKTFENSYFIFEHMWSYQRTDKQWHSYVYMNFLHFSKIYALFIQWTLWNVRILYIYATLTIDEPFGFKGKTNDKIQLYINDKKVHSEKSPVDEIHAHIFIKCLIIFCFSLSRFYLDFSIFFCSFCF